MAITLPPLAQTVRIVDERGLPTAAFLQYWNTSLLPAIAQVLQDQADAIADIQLALRSLSYPTGAVVEGVADGATAQATVSAHTRTYLDAEIAVDGGAVSGLAYGALNFIYYDDPNSAGGAVTYAATTVQADALTSAANPGRHFVGSVLTPASSGDPPTVGNPSTGAGGVEVQ